MAREGLSLLLLVATANFLLTLFNVLPVFPMDGGRALAAILALAVGQAEATRVVTVFGLVTAVVAIPLVLLLTGNPLLRLTAVLTAGLVLWVGLQQARSWRVHVLR